MSFEPIHLPTKPLPPFVYEALPIPELAKQWVAARLAGDHAVQNVIAGVIHETYPDIMETVLREWPDVARSVFHAIERQSCLPISSEDLERYFLNFDAPNESDFVAGRVLRAGKALEYLTLLPIDCREFWTFIERLSRAEFDSSQGRESR